MPKLNPTNAHGAAGLAFDDPVPSDPCLFLESIPAVDSASSLHAIEQKVAKLLRAHPDLRFSSLTVRRTQDGVCIDGVLESAASVDVGQLVSTIDGVGEVHNHLVTRPRTTPSSPRQPR